MSHPSDPESPAEVPASSSTETGPETDGEFASQLGEFHLIRKLGSGGMADVYLAEQSSLKRKVALKVLRPELLGDDTYLQRFAREAKAAAGLNHANIVQVYAVGEEDGRHYIAQEFVQGMNLREYLTKKGPPEAGVAIHIIHQVAAALQAAAAAGIVHRDIKPENILLTRQGIVKVTDFGLAQLNQDTDPTHLTQVGTTMGTPLYMSPEQVNGARVDHRSDIYSLGVTSYHLLAGRPPFRGETAISVAVQHINKAPQPLAMRRSDLPRRLCELVHRMMAKNPDERLADATSVLAELEILQRRLKLPQPSTIAEWSDYEPPVSLWTRATSWLPDLGWRRHAHWLILPVACLIVAILSAATTWLARAADPLTAPSSATESVPRAERVEDQFSYAMIVNNEEAWQAVITNFPDEQLFVQRARQRLAIYYLRTLRIEKARPIYDELILAGANDPELMASGLAGQAVIYCHEGQFQVSNDLIAKRLRPLRDHLDLEMETLVRAAIARNQRQLGIQLEDFFRDTAPAKDRPDHESAHADTLIEQVLDMRRLVPVVNEVSRFLISPELSLLSLFTSRNELQEQFENLFREVGPDNGRPAD